MSSSPDPVVAGWPTAFRGSAAIAAGRVTRDRLRGPSFLRLFPDVYVTVPEKPPPDLALRSRAAYRLVAGRGVVSGYSAAELLGASCGPVDAPAEVTVPGGGLRTHPGLLVHRDQLAPGETMQLGDVRATSAMRTAFDLARRPDLDLTERVVAVDALANHARFNPDLLLNFMVHYPRARRNVQVATVLTYTDAKAGSPMESRLRMTILLAGLPTPQVQYVVQDEAARTAIWLDLAYPRHKIGIEYEGADHTRPDQVLRDAGRYTRLVDRGWRIYRYTKYDVYHDRPRIIAELTRALAAAEKTRVR